MHHLYSSYNNDQATILNIDWEAGFHKAHVYCNRVLM